MDVRQLQANFCFVVSVFQSVPGDMVAGGFMNSKCSFYMCSSHVVILGLILVHYLTVFSSHVQASPVNCKSENISSRYQHCVIHPDGVRDLDCFGKHNWYGEKICVWKPGSHTAKKTYTLITRQDRKKSCKIYSNLTEISTKITLYKSSNMTAEVFENIESTNCTKSDFRGSPWRLLRCGPPSNVTFSRRSGSLDVNVNWPEEDVKVIKDYSVRYKALGSQLWNKLSVQSQTGRRCTVKNLNSSLVYVVQVQCVTGDKCSQCPWSDTYTVPSELTTHPVIVTLDERDVAERKGCRLLSLTWKFASQELHDGYYVTVGKASREASYKPISTTQTEITLILSYSAYHLNISAFNNASVSPAVSQTIPQREVVHGMEAGKLNVSVHSNVSFTIYWKDDLIKTYVCYSVEWREKGHEAVSMSFYQDAMNHRTLSPLTKPLKPYKRYSITLHTRPDNDTCNMKHINNSESTYGSTHFYFIEGSPVSAPTNISRYSVTLDSMVLQWSSIPEEDIRGFLLGYTIHYAEYCQRDTCPERNVTVDPKFNSYELGDLKSDTVYQVQISGFTSAGSGVRSTRSIFKTNHQDYFSLSNIITTFAVVASLLIFGCPIIKRAKSILWPSIPDPGKSNTMQKIDRPCEQELLESISIMKVEEWDTNSLHVVEKEAAIPVSVLPSTLPLLHNSEDEEEPPEVTHTWDQRDTNDASGDTTPEIQQTNFQSSPLAFSSGYTTMEMFQHVMPPGTSANKSVAEVTESEPDDVDVTVVKSGFDYVSYKFCTSPVSGSEEISTTA
ncbi:hypothetical protein PAMA_007566 [Pampus argenteus]